MEPSRSSFSAALQLGPAESSGLVTLQITRVLFPKTYTTLSNIRNFADCLNAAVKNGTGEAVLVADPVLYDERRYTKIRLTIQANESNSEFTARGIFTSGFDTEERFPDNMKIIWPWDFLMKNVLALNAWCSNPALTLNLPLRVDAQPFAQPDLLRRAGIWATKA